jgi:hypothetical protein
MAETTPELNTVGALMRFAVSLEEEAADRYTEWSAAARAPASLSELALEHRTRAERLTRMLREQLNEMILEPISGLSVADYQAPASVLAGLERKLARLYADIVSRAGHVLPGATRTLARFGERSEQLARGTEAR